MGPYIMASVLVGVMAITFRLDDIVYWLATKSVTLREYLRASHGITVE